MSITVPQPDITTPLPTNSPAPMTPPRAETGIGAEFSGGV
jgi:hypothetical protein